MPWAKIIQITVFAALYIPMVHYQVNPNGLAIFLFALVGTAIICVAIPNIFLTLFRSVSGLLQRRVKRQKTPDIDFPPFGGT